MTRDAWGGEARVERTGSVGIRFELESCSQQAASACVAVAAEGRARDATSDACT